MACETARVGSAIYRLPLIEDDGDLTRPYNRPGSLESQ